MTNPYSDYTVSSSQEVTDTCRETTDHSQEETTEPTPSRSIHKTCCHIKNASIRTTSIDVVVARAHRATQDAIDSIKADAARQPPQKFAKNQRNFCNTLAGCQCIKNGERCFFPGDECVKRWMLPTFKSRKFKSRLFMSRD